MRLITVDFTVVMLFTAAVYLTADLLFAIPFVWVGVKQIDPHTARAFTKLHREDLRSEISHTHRPASSPPVGSI